MGNVNWYMAIGAGLVGSIGLMSFNAVLAKATPQNLGNLCVMMVLVQTAIPAIYQAVMTGSVTFNKGLGFGFAALAAWFLLL